MAGPAPTSFPAQSLTLSDHINEHEPACRTLEPALSDLTTSSQSSSAGAPFGLLNKGSRCAQHLTHPCVVLASQDEDAMTVQDDGGIHLATSLSPSCALQQATCGSRRMSIKPSTMRYGNMLTRSLPLSTQLNGQSERSVEDDCEDKDKMDDRCLSTDSSRPSTKRTCSPQRSFSRPSSFGKYPRRSSMRRPSSISCGSALQQTPLLNSSFGHIDDYEDEADLAACASMTEPESTLAEEDVEDEEPISDNSDNDVISVNDYLKQKASRLSRPSSVNSFSSLTPSMSAESSSAAQPLQNYQLAGMFTRLTPLSPYTQSMYDPSSKLHGRSGSSATIQSSPSSAYNDSQLFDFDEAEELMDTDEELVPSEGSPRFTKPSNPQAVHSADKPTSSLGQDSWYSHVDQWRLKTFAIPKRNSLSVASLGMRPKESHPSMGPKSASALLFPARRRISVLSQLSPLTPLHRY